MISFQLFIAIFFLLLATSVDGSVFRFEYLPVAHVRTDPVLSQTCLSDHVHTFYGPPLVYPEVTFEDLRASDPNQSSGSVLENLSLYWHPSVYAVQPDGTRVLANQQWTTIYYNYDVGEATAFPAGFRMIGNRNREIQTIECVGDSSCSRTDGSCGMQATNDFFPTSSCYELEVSMVFPSCWDGETLDTIDQSHVAYTNGDGECDSDHQVKIPEIEFFFRIFDYQGGPHEFSDGSGTFHADYVAGWDMTKLQDILDHCELEERIDMNKDYCGGRPFPVQFRDGIVYTGDDLQLRAALQANRVPEVDTSCITTEAINNISELPREECSGDILATRCDSGFNPATPTPVPPSDEDEDDEDQDEEEDEDQDEEEDEDDEDEEDEEDEDEEDEEEDEDEDEEDEDEEDEEEDEDEDEGGGLGCFSASSVVEVAEKGFVTIDQLELGDKVRVKGDVFETVYSFGHRDKDVQAYHLSIHCSQCKGPLVLTKNHLVTVPTATSFEFVSAGTLAVGDFLLTPDGSHAEVTSIDTVLDSGYYAPFTPSGTIVVNGVVASNYIDVVPHWVAHISQTFHRMWALNISTEESYVNGISTKVNWMMQACHWFLPLSMS